MGESERAIRFKVRVVLLRSLSRWRIKASDVFINTDVRLSDRHLIKAVVVLVTFASLNDRYQRSSVKITIKLVIPIFISRPF